MGRRIKMRKILTAWRRRVDTVDRAYCILERVDGVSRRVSRALEHPPRPTGVQLTEPFCARQLLFTRWCIEEWKEKALQKRWAAIEVEKQRLFDGWHEWAERRGKARMRPPMM